LQAAFDQDKQLKYRSALAASLGTTAEAVEILSITEGRRRQGQGIKVENKVWNDRLVRWPLLRESTNHCTL
jgi:hypothetical protein